ncbi:hypothetical protein ABZY44_06950 [Streptomyces sp. NPDC006544]|uniref:hypothetical protein n=1 Tax=Streptomyces sp. NPDC006544 TaxID=3154583 RepID=UPI0033A0E500
MIHDLLNSLVRPGIPADREWSDCSNPAPAPTQLSTARYRMSQDTDIRWIGCDGPSALDIALTSGEGPLVNWIRSSGALIREEFPRD